jgi:hypothetical protein
MSMFMKMHPAVAFIGCADECARVGRARVWSGTGRTFHRYANKIVSGGLRSAFE